jgi:ABC-type metal ion transport system substrate-binding protein
MAEKNAERFGVVERDLAVITSNYATRADVSDAKNAIILWVVGAIVAWGSTVVAVAMFIAKHP